MAVVALNRPDLAGAAFDIGGPEAPDGNQVAERFTRVLGRPITYVPVPLDDYERSLAQIFGPVVAGEIANQFRWSSQRGNAVYAMADICRELGVQLTPLESWIRQQDWSLPA